MSCVSETAYAFSSKVRREITRTLLSVYRQDGQFQPFRTQTNLQKKLRWVTFSGLLNAGPNSGFRLVLCCRGPTVQTEINNFIDSYTSYLYCSNRPKDKKMEDCAIKSGPASNEMRRDSTKCTIDNQIFSSSVKDACNRLSIGYFQSFACKSTTYWLVLRGGKYTPWLTSCMEHVG